MNFIFGISHSKGVMLCVPFEGTITADKMVAIVQDHFAQAFACSNAPRTKRCLMDNCPRQKSIKALRAYDTLHATAFWIPPRSPDLDSIENFFNLVTRELDRQAIQRNITR